MQILWHDCDLGKRDSFYIYTRERWIGPTFLKLLESQNLQAEKKRFNWLWSVHALEPADLKPSQRQKLKSPNKSPHSPFV